MNVIKTELKDVIAKALECDVESIHDDAGLSNHYNWDSLGQLAIMVALEEKYHIDINEHNANQFLSLAQIIKYLENNA